MQTAEWDTSKHGIIGMYIRHFVCHNFLYTHDKLKRRGKTKPFAQLVPILTGINIVSSAPAIPNILCLVPHILKGNDIQRQEAGILREGTEETRDRKKAVHICFTAIFQAMERRPQNELRSSSFSSWYGLRGIPEPD